MINNDDLDDDFDDGDFDLDGFDDDLGGFEAQNSLADLWKNNPAVKIGVIAVGALLLVGAVMFVGGGEDDVVSSRVTGSSAVDELPGTSQLSPAMEEALQEENNRRIEDARRTGDSVIPMPTDPLQGKIPIQFEEKVEEDPLERWRQMQEQRLQNDQVNDTPASEIPVEVVDTRTPAVNALSEAMAVQMEAILGNQGIPSIQVKAVSPEDYLERIQMEAQKKREAALAKLQQQQVAADSDVITETATILVPAGTIEYAQMVTEANTDAPGPILAEIASGPLKGARLIGSFKMASNRSAGGNSTGRNSTAKYLTLNFNTVVLDGIGYNISAIALDPNTTLPGVATDINRRYLQRVVFPAAAAFITGLTEAIAQSGTTTITVPSASGNGVVSQQDQNLNSDQEVSAGIAEAGEEIGEILDDIADGVSPLIRVRAGTPIGVLFTEPVLDQPDLGSSADQS